MTSALRVELFGPVHAQLPVAERIHDLLADADKEFVPSLSQRDAADPKSLSPDAQAEASRLDSYVAQVLNRQCIVAYMDGVFVGLMAFVPDHQEPLLGPANPSSYITTVAVAGRARGRGVARALYAKVLTLPSELASPFVATRTWSGNVGHISLLAKVGFVEVARLEDDRGPGVDTVYYARALTASREERYGEA